MNRRSLSLLVLIICAVLVLLPSCKKKVETETADTPAETTAVVESPVIETSADSVAAADTKAPDDAIFSPSPVVIEREETEAQTEHEELLVPETESQETTPGIDYSSPLPESPVVEEEKGGDDTFFSGLFSYRGIESLITVGRTKTTLTIPEGVTFEDLLLVASVIRTGYPLESSIVVYDITEGTVVLTYPEQTEEYLILALEYLDTEAKAYIDSLYFIPETEDAPEEKAEESAAESAVYSGTLSYKGYVSSVAVRTTDASLTVPEGITSRDIAYYASLINAEYPGEASLVTYTLENGVLMLYYPEQSKEYLLSALDILIDEAVHLIDSIENQAPAPLEEKTLPIVETVEEEKKAEMETSDLPVLPADAEEKAERAEDAERELSSPEAGRKEKVVRGFSIAAYVVPEYVPSFSDKGWTPLNFGAGVKFEADLTKSVALGLSVQYDFSRFMEAGTYLRWTFADMDKVKLYSTLGFGGVFGLPDNSGNNSLFISGGVGCEYFFAPSFSLFCEASLEWSKSLGFETGMEIGLRYSF